MSLSESMFLFEIVLEEFQSCVGCKDFVVHGQFADLFTLIFIDPGSTRHTFLKRINNVHGAKGELTRRSRDDVRDRSKSILFACNIYKLIMYMKKYPLQLSLRTRKKPDNLIGATSIQWDHSFFKYLCSLSKTKEISPISVCGEHFILDDATTSKCIARLKVQIRFCHLHDRIPIQFRSNSENNVGIFNFTGYLTTQNKANDTLNNSDCKIDGVIETKHDAKPMEKENKKHINNYNKIESKHTGKNKQKDMKEIVESNAIEEIITLAKSETNFSVSTNVSVEKCNSFFSLLKTDSVKCSKLTFPLGNQVYIVGYCSVYNDFTKSKSSGSNSTSRISFKDYSSESDQPKLKYKLKTCASDCPLREKLGTSESGYSIDVPRETSKMVKIAKCSDLACTSKKREPPEPEDDRVLLDLSNVQESCCNFTEKIEEIVGGMRAKIKVEGIPCECSCECTFGFAKKTTYCEICGGYEKPGDELMRKPASAMVPPCPVFHKLVDAKRLRTCSTSGSDSKKSIKPSSGGSRGSTNEKKKSGKTLSEKHSTESERETTKKGKKKDDNRFKFNYGYQAPHIGHCDCTSPCTGTMNPVPKKMGWLWTADNVPGLKFRPYWKPGAIHKYVVRLLRMAKNPGEVLAKKKKKEGGKKKRNEKRPLLIVHKKDGEYTVTMETMRNYSKQRTPNQYPYEDKPVLTYTIGRTEEENRQRQKKKDRDRRRLEREQRNFIQSAFKNMCEEICLKTYQQALGLLPDAEDPQCKCFPAEPDAEKLGLDLSCSCSEDKMLESSDTDSDEWIVEFTPPVATFDPTFKPKKIFKLENSTQYTYMDYRVKLLDRYGTPVPRFFWGPCGQVECSDLGGFWGPGHTWLEINVDGYIAPDGRWAPNSFTGPNGEQVDAEIGRFQAANGNWLVVGVDGFIDCQGRWRYYAKPCKPKKRDTKSKACGDKKDLKLAYKLSETVWSCFGDASAVDLSEKGIVGHAKDKKLLYNTLKHMLEHGENVKLPTPSTVPRLAPKTSQKKAHPNIYLTERTKCRHPTPSQKGVIVDSKGNKKYFRMKSGTGDGHVKERRQLKKRRTDYAEGAGVTFHDELYPTVGI